MIIPGVLARHEPAGPGIPLLFDLPHSGRAYPADFNPAPPELILRRAEDAYVDDLLVGVEARG
ncbi:MAG: N-formylglutamate amidohydrolase, partial [Rhodobacterales bacterium]|nr:N-formylglutamate amidohydrolase [Rhodobacterales bacterium]